MNAQDDKLQRVHLMASPAMESRFTNFQKLFIEKYGQPNHDKADRKFKGTYTRTSSWFLPSTKIELTYMIFGAAGKINSYLVIWYDDSKLNKDKLDKL
jgi:hypothetical protein